MDFILLLVAKNGMPSPSEMQTLLKKYGIWSSKYKDSGNYIGGFPLSREGYRITKWIRQGEVLTNLSLKQISGYIHIKANSFEKALQIAQECPLVEYNEIILKPTIKH